MNDLHCILLHSEVALCIVSCLCNKWQLHGGDSDCYLAVQLQKYSGFVSIKQNLIYCLPSAQRTIGYNWIYNDMFRITQVIVRLRSGPLIVFNDCAFWDPKRLTMFTSY
jgi:hypothetical protein